MDLSPLARDILSAGDYSRIVAPSSAPALAHQWLDGVTPDQLFTRLPDSPAVAWAALAALWLWHDGLHECHEIVQQSALQLHQRGYKAGENAQSLHSVRSQMDLNDRKMQDMDATNSFWHAIMHRREGDFSNSKYWFARCTGHPAHASFLASAAELLSTAANADIARRLRTGRDGYALVDLAEKSEDNPADATLRETVVQLQRLEWAAIFEETVRSV